MVPGELLAELRAVRAAVAAEGGTILDGWRPWIERPDFLESATNLACYLALRHRDLRRLQNGLMALGLSSLGRAEGRVLASLDATIASLAAVAGVEARPRPDRTTFFRGDALPPPRTSCSGMGLVRGRGASWSPAQARRPRIPPSSPGSPQPVPMPCGSIARMTTQRRGSA